MTTEEGDGERSVDIASAVLSCSEVQEVTNTAKEWVDGGTGWVSVDVVLDAVFDEVTTSALWCISDTPSDD